MLRIMESTLIVLALAAVALALGWLVATWDFADNTPAFATKAADRITIKVVIKNALPARRWTTAPEQVELKLFKIENIKQSGYEVGHEWISGLKSRSGQARLSSQDRRHDVEAL